MQAHGKFKLYVGPQQGLYGRFALVTETHQFLKCVAVWLQLGQTTVAFQNFHDTNVLESPKDMSKYPNCA